MNLNLLFLVNYVFSDLEMKSLDIPTPTPFPVSGTSTLC